MQFQGQLRWYVHFYVNSEILLPKKFLKSRTAVFKKKTYSKFKKHKIPILKFKNDSPAYMYVNILI